jgi:hypothetical protein
MRALMILVSWDKPGVFAIGFAIQLYCSKVDREIIVYLV